MGAINTKRPMRLFDDRGKVSEKYEIGEIFFEDDYHCLCAIKDTDFSKVLFDKSSGKVLSENFMFWFIENFDTPETLLAKKAIDHVKNTYCNHHDLTCMVLGDVTDLITLITGVEVTIDDILNEK